MHLTSATHKFSDKMAPHGDFLMYFRKDVILTFKDKSLKDDKSRLGQQIHLFRYPCGVKIFSTSYRGKSMDSCRTKAGVLDT